MEYFEAVIEKLWLFFCMKFDILGYSISFFDVFIVSAILGMFGYLYFKLTD